MSSATSKARHDGSDFIGPLFGWELVFVSRQGKGFLPRFVYALILLVILWFHLSFDQLTPQMASQLSERTFVAVLWLQYGAVALLTPIYVAGAILEARQQQTLALLMTTYLTPREIILGKWLGRLMPMLALVLTGLPVLAILQFLGGVSFSDLVLHTGLALLLMLAVGMYAMNASTTSQSMGEAFTKTYGIFVLVSVSFSCIASFFAWDAFTTGNYSIWLTFMVTCHVVCGLIVLGNAIKNISHREHDHDLQSVSSHGHYQKIKFQKSSSKKRGAQPLVYHTTTRPEVPRVWRYPVLWKETYFPYSTLQVLLNRVLFLMPVLLIALLAVNGDASARKEEQLVVWIRNVVMLLFLCLTTLHAVGVFTTQRIKKTLFPLLTTPLSHQQILVEFWLGTLVRYRWFALATGLLILITMPFQGPAFLLLLPCFLCQLGLFTLLGITLSFVLPQLYQSRLMVGVFFFLSVLVLPGALASRQITLPFFAQMSLMPFHSWAQLSYPYDKPLLGITSNQFVSDFSIISDDLVLEFFTQIVTLLGIQLGLILLCRWLLARWQQRA